MPGRVRIFAVLIVAGPALAQSAAAGPLINRAYTEKARYLPGESVAIHVELQNTTGAAWSGAVSLEIRLGTVVVHEAQSAVALSAQSGVTEQVFAWTAPQLDYRGYSVEVRAGAVDQAVTAIDVSSDWTRFPRYGYLTQFYNGQPQATSAALIRQLVEDYHLDALQFYDWMWRHEKVIQRPRPGVVNDPWIDWRGAAISFGVLEDLIAAAHSRSVAAMPYFQIYGAREDYATLSGVDPQWGIYADPGHATQHAHDLKSAEGIWLYLFDPANTAWQNHLMGEVDDAILALDFDGVHFDQLGYKNPIYSYAGVQLDFSSGWSFQQMLARARAELDGLAAQQAPAVGRRAVTFNLVGAQVDGWGAPEVVSQGDCDFLYAEVWGNERYQGIVDYVRWTRGGAGGAALVLPSYLNYYDEMPEFSAPAARLATAAFAVAGAYRLELGDGDHMLSHEFFPWVRKQMTPGLRAAMKGYYSFLTAYQNVLFDRALDDGDQGAQWIAISGANVSTVPGGDAIWVQRRKTDAYSVVHLVNLLGNDDQWRNPANAPAVLTDLPVTVHVGAGAAVDSVVAVSPDDGGVQTELAFSLGSDITGPYVAFTLPRLEYWTTLFIHRRLSAPASGRYEAEDGLKTNVAVDTDHGGYSGAAFVDEFTSGANEGVAFSICVPADGVYDLRWGYANGGRIAASRSVYVDGAYAGDVVFPPLQNWDAWAETSKALQLSAGPREVVVGFGGSGAINLDYLDVPAPTNGLRGQYFDAPAFADAVMTRVDATIDFDWAGGAPDSSMGSDTFMARWSGWVRPPLTGRYTFTVDADDDARLFVNDVMLVDDWDGAGTPPQSGEIVLAGGQWYRIVLAYREVSGSAHVALKWSAPGLNEQIVPEDRLKPDGCTLDDQPPTAPADLTASAGAAQSIALQWSPSTDDVALAGYEVLRDGLSVAFTSTSGFADATPLAGAMYTYVVRARDVLGNTSAPSLPAMVTAPGTRVLGDIDGDGMVTVTDFSRFGDCFAGPGVTPDPVAPPTAGECLAAFDADGDTDVDLADFGALMPLFVTVP